MILLDSRDGSKELLAPLRKAGLEVESARLEFGDLYFWGRGKGGEAVNVVVEYKHLPEFIASVRDKRLQGHQAPGMRADYGEHAALYVLVEGELHRDPRGVLTRRVGNRLFKPIKGSMTANELFHRLNVMQLCSGVAWVITRDQGWTVQWIESLYRTWTDKDLDQHKSHLGVYEVPPDHEPSLVEYVASKIPGIAWGKAAEIGKRFAKIEDMQAATMKDWLEIPGIGAELASRAIVFLEEN